MLVLSRKQGEKVCIGDDIVLTVVSIDRGKVRIGVVAPKDVSVDRQEVRDEKVMAAYAASKGATP